VIIERAAIGVSGVMKSVDDELKVLGHRRVSEHERLKKLAAVIVNGSQDIAIQTLIIATVTSEGSHIVKIEKCDQIKNRLEKQSLHEWALDEVHTRLDKRRDRDAGLSEVGVMPLPSLD
jgi:hypothetical protein